MKVLSLNLHIYELNFSCEGECGVPSGDSESTVEEQEGAEAKKAGW